MIDCCKAPEGVGQGDVFVMAANMVTVESYMASESGLFSTTGLGESLQATHKFVAETAKGAWNTISKPIGDMASKAWSSISTKFTGTAANSAGNTSLSMLGDAGAAIGDFFGVNDFACEP